jgi:hypothetical protein
MTTSSFDSLNLNVNLMYDKLIKFTIYKTMELIEENQDFLEDKEQSVQDLFETISETINYKISGIPGLTTKTPKVKKELTDDTTRTREVPDEDRCMCRTMYHKIHLNSDKKTLKIMREDPKNLYGDRCKIRRSSKPGSLFCTRHSTFQPYGVWNGIYDGECLKFVNNTEGKTVTTKKTSSATNATKKTSSDTNATKKTSSDNDSPLNDCLIDSDDESKASKKEKKTSSGKFKKTSSDNDCLIDSDDESKASKKEKKIRMNISLDDIDAFIAKQVAAPSGAALVALRATQKKPLDKPQETVKKSSQEELEEEQETNQVALDDGKEVDEIETEEIIIDDVVYNIDCEDNLYNDDGEFLGKYDHSKNIIIKP